MKYILDFDGVIFNTEALKKKMAELGIEESARSAVLFDEIKEKDPAFEIESLVYEDARRFIHAHASDCEIVSSFVSTDPHNNQNSEIQQLYQQRKIELSGVMSVIGATHVHVVGQSKAEALSKLQEKYDNEGVECMFIDDRRIYVEEATDLGIKTFWMNRRKSGGTLESMSPYEAHEVHSFDELEVSLQSWKK